MQLLKYFAIILLAFVISHQCGAVSPTGGSITKPEQNEGFHQGDMILPPNSKSPTGKGVAIRSTYQRWAGGVVPYEFASNISTANQAFIVQQMRTMENLTQVNSTQCIQFRPKTVNDLYFITIFNGSGCYAPVGSWGNYIGTRPVSYFDGYYATCMVTGIIQHELTHVLGFYHEQSRPDRDSYVSIQWANIDPSQAFNFDKYNDSQVDTQQTSYDYGSVMHYEWNAFALNSSSPTIVATQNASAYFGQRVQLSPIDILEIQRYYNCVATPGNPTSTTGNTAATTISTIGGTSAKSPTTTTSTSTSKTTSSTSTSSTTSKTTSSSSTSSTASKTTTTSATTTSATTRTTTSATTATTTSATTATTIRKSDAGIRMALQAQFWLIPILHFFRPFYQ